MQPGSWASESFVAWEIEAPVSFPLASLALGVGFYCLLVVCRFGELSSGHSSCCWRFFLDFRRLELAGWC